MSIQTQVIKGAEIKQREFPVIFDVEIPGRVIAKAVAIWNEKLAQFSGRCFIPEIPRPQIINGETCLVSYLQADDLGWESFLDRDVSITPHVNNQLEGIIDRSVSVDLLYAS